MSDRPLMSWRPILAALFLSGVMLAAIMIVLACCGVRWGVS